MVAACPFPSPQGSQVLVRQLCARLVARGHDVELLTYAQGAALQSQGYQHHRIRRLPGDDAARSGPTPVKPMLDALMVGRLGRMLAEGGSAPFDVVHGHNDEGALVAGVCGYDSGALVVDEKGVELRLDGLYTLCATQNRQGWMLEERGMRDSFMHFEIERSAREDYAAGAGPGFDGVGTLLDAIRSHA